jgi:hypothetical protein
VVGGEQYPAQGGAVRSVPHDDRFAVRFLLDVTNTQSGERKTVDEIGIFTVVDGKITREEFFYPVG